MLLINLLFPAMLGLHCCAWAFSSCGKWGLLSTCIAQALGTQTLVAVAHGLSRPKVCGIFPGQGLNRCPLHCKAES